jgi:hypothetical protein
MKMYLKKNDLESLSNGDLIQRLITDPANGAAYRAEALRRLARDEISLDCLNDEEGLPQPQLGADVIAMAERLPLLKDPQEALAAITRSDETFVKEKMDAYVAAARDALPYITGRFKTIVLEVIQQYDETGSMSEEQFLGVVHTAAVDRYGFQKAKRERMMKRRSY